jgi:hypothetical protein
MGHGNRGKTNVAAVLRGWTGFPLNGHRIAVLAKQELIHGADNIETGFPLLSPLQGNGGSVAELLWTCTLPH